MALPIISENVSQTELDDMMDNALTASNFLKAISHEGAIDDFMPSGIGGKICYRT